MVVSRDDFHLKGVPGCAMVVKPCGTSSQVSLACSSPQHPTQKESPARPTILKVQKCVFFDFYTWKLVRPCFPYLLN